jgi:hypothetical protein
MSKNKNQKKKAKDKKSGSKKKYKIRNWHEYNESLVNRGRLDVWIEECVLENWQAKPVGKPGAQTKYSDLAIVATLQFGQVFGQKLRQTEGLVKSIFELMDIEQRVPDHSTLSRRAKNVSIELPQRINNQAKLTLLVDSSGLKVFGEGEWKVRKHGYSKHRTWRKMHLIITPNSLVRQAELTGNEVADDEMAVELLAREQAGIEVLAGDGAFDTKKVYDKCQERQISQILIPPQINAKIWQHGNCQAPPHPRDENLRQIRMTSRKRWKEASGYHIRSLSETAMFRFKTIFGDRLKARDFSRQRTEFLIKIAALNKMTSLGMPQSYAVVA